MAMDPRRNDRVTPTELDRLVIVDVGAAGGLLDHWSAWGDLIRPVGFEPNTHAAAELRRIYEKYPGALVFDHGLFSEDATRTLFSTKVNGCSSVLRPNRSLLSRYAIAPAFDVIAETPVMCRRYDTLFAAGEVPQPDVVKIDVQGGELDVLHGFGGLLTGCIGIELEAHAYPIYERQGLFGDIVSYLDRFEFALRRVDKHETFDGEAVEFDLYFTKRPSRLPEPAERSLRKLEVINQAWQLITTDNGARMAAIANREFPA